MRILAISHNYPHQDDPVCGIFAARQFRFIKQLGHDIHVVVPLAYMPAWVSRYERYKLFRTRTLICESGVKAEVFRYLRPPGRLGLLVDGPSAACAVQKKLIPLHREKPFDAILARGFWLEAEIGIRLSRLLDVPVAAVGIGSDVNVVPTLGKIFGNRFCRLAQSVDLAMATGKSVAEKITAVNHRETPVIGGVVDLEQFKPLAEKKSLRKALHMPLDKTIFLYVGHLIKAKGLYELIEAVREIKERRSDLYLVICGDGSEKKSLELLISSHKLEDDICLAGNIPPQEIHRWYQMSDVFVLPSHQEGMPNVVMEAMACGLPTVAARVGGLPAALKNCPGAILVEPQDVHSLAESLLSVLSDEMMRKRMADAARQRARERFGIEQNVNLMMRYMEMMKEQYAHRR